MAMPRGNAESIKRYHEKTYKKITIALRKEEAQDLIEAHKKGNSRRNDG